MRNALSVPACILFFESRALANKAPITQSTRDLDVWQILLYSSRIINNLDQKQKSTKLSRFYDSNIYRNVLVPMRTGPRMHIFEKWLYFSHFSSCTRHMTVKLVQHHSADMLRCVRHQKQQNSVSGATGSSKSNGSQAMNIIRVLKMTTKWRYFSHFSSCTRHMPAKLVRDHSADMLRCVRH